MIEFWATVGRICIDGAFHHAIFPLTDHNASFEELVSLQEFFRDHNLRLSRWEVMSSNRTVSQDWDGQKTIHFENADQDEVVIKIRNAFGARDPFPFPENVEFCAVVGLACIEERHRNNFHDASDPDENRIEKLRELLVTAGGSGPKFRLTDNELKALNRLIRSGGDQMVTFMERFHSGRWVQPLVRQIFGACEAGSSLKSYLHVSQQDLALFLARHPDGEKLISQMKDAKAIL